MTSGTSLAVREPELRLPAFNAALQRLRPYLEGDDVEQAADVLAQTLATELVHSMDLLGVTGTQGAGKTTLMREVYGDLVEPWLRENAGRGEKLAVIIYEEPGRTDAAARLHVLPDKASGSSLLRTESVVDLGEWETALHGGRPDVVLAELLVPETVFAGARRGFLLLPGYEITQRDNAAFQARMQRQLSACGGFVIVSDHARLAQDAEREILNDLREHFAQGADLIVVISRTEALSEAKRNELKASAREVLIGSRTSTDSYDYIVTSGRGEAYASIWRPQFVNAAQSAGVLTAQVRRNQIRQLRDLLGQDFTQMLGRGRDRVSAEQDLRTADSAYGDALALFDKQSAAVRKVLARDVTQLVDRRGVDVEAAAVQYVCDNELGWSASWRGVTTFLGLRKNRRDERIAEHVVSHWKSQLTGGLTHDALEVVEAASRSEVLRIVPVAAYSDSSSSVPAQRKAVEPFTLPAGVQQTLMTLSGADRSLTLPGDQTVHQTYELLPALTLSYLALGMRLAPEEVAALGADAGIAGQSLTSALQAMAGENKAMVAGVVGLFGLDLLLDGKLDSLHALAGGLSALLTGGSAPAAAMLAPAAALVGVAAGIGLMNYAIRDGEQAEALARRLTRAHGLAIQERFLSSVDAALDAARDVLDRRLQEYFRVDEGLALTQRTYKAIADVEREHQRLREDLHAARVSPF